jgi:amino acid permease
MNTYEERRERQRRFLRQNFIWLVPLGAFVGVGLFIGLGFLVAWLWRVTLGDIFGVKPISFWQAWGLMLLSQILFKAHMQGNLRSMHARHRERAAATAAGTPEQEV